MDATKPFNWTNEAKGKAAVHVVIIGFSQGVKSGKKPLWEYPNTKLPGTRSDVANINGYLLAGGGVLITNRSAPLRDTAQPMRFGSMPNDGGHLLLNADEAAAVRISDPQAAKYLRKTVGAAEMIQGKERWCLWLISADPATVRTSTFLASRLAACRNFRAGSRREATRNLATTPGLFGERRQPTTQYLAVPGVSSERRTYIPMALFPSEVIATNALLTVANATVVTFGILSSSVFNLWTATVSGRLKSDYRISAEITYNNFPFPEMTASQTAAVEKAAQAVLDVRAQSPDSTLADLYDPLAMPAPLVKAHRDLDRVVLATYALKGSSTDAQVLAALFARYQALVTPADETKT